ncbi:MAG TPA: hypothetical protein VFB15_09775 [Candidatus Binataceae bacterium]|nr:hypothetical protein [Candidatus Binataceae bacterium]
MKQFSVGVMLGVLATWGIGHAANNINHNGEFWNSLNGAAKNGYVAGYDDAMQVSTGKLESLSIAANLFHWKGADKIIHQLTTELSDGGMTQDEIVRQLDKLYANPKYSELDLGQALQLLAAKTSFDEGGNPPPTATSN